MTMAEATRFQFAADLRICRILNGMWQVSGAHGDIDPVRAVDEMFAYHDAGFTTWDLADHYGPAEDLIGHFRRLFAARHGGERLPEIQAFTKWVPAPGPMTRRVVEGAIDLLASANGRRTPRPAPIPLVGLQRPALPRRAQTSGRPAARWQNPSPRADQFRHRASGA